MLQVAQSENGLLFINGAGQVVFHGRHHCLTASRSTTSQFTFGDATGELPYIDLQPAYDDTLIYNDISVSYNDIAGSQTAYGPSTLTRDLLNL